MKTYPPKKINKFSISFSFSFPNKKTILFSALIWGGCMMFFFPASLSAQTPQLPQVFKGTTNKNVDKEQNKNQIVPSSQKDSEQKKRDKELLDVCLKKFEYPLGRVYATFSTVSYDKKISTYKLLLWTNEKKVSIFSVLHPQNGLQERIRFFPDKEYMHIFWTSRQKLLTRNIVSDVRSRYEISVENSPLYFSDLHLPLLLSQYNVITDEYDDIFSDLDTIRGKTIPHARRWLFEQLRQRPKFNSEEEESYKIITLQSKIAALHDMYALSEKPFDSLQKPNPPRSYYGYIAVYVKDELIRKLEYFDSDGYFLKSLKFTYKPLPVKSSKEVSANENLFPVLWEIVEPAQKKITRVEFLYSSPDKPVQKYYFSDDYFVRP